MLQLPTKETPILCTELEHVTVHYIDQRTPEWYNLRCGRFTGTSCAKLLLGKESAKDKHVYDKAAERVTGEYCDGEEYENVHIKRGNEMETIARDLYIDDNICAFLDLEVTTPGFVQAGEYLGYSPDGFVGTDGMIEIKALDSNNHFRQVLEITTRGVDAIDPKHYLQMQFGMLICNRQWCDYVLYNAKHGANRKELFIYRVLIDQVKQDIIRQTLEKRIMQLQILVDQYNTLDKTRFF